MFLSKRLKNIIIYTVLISSMAFIVLALRYLEINVEFFSDFHNFLIQRELDYGTIGNAYITIAVAVISLGTISFTILIGRMQHLVNEISYQSFDNRVLKDRRTNLTYITLMCIATLLIIIYLLADIYKYPLMYLSFLIMSFIAIIWLLYYLFFSMMKDLSIYYILDNNSAILNDKIIELKKLYIVRKFFSHEFQKLEVKKTKGLYHRLLSRIVSIIDKRIDFVKDFYIAHSYFCASELSFIVGNACQRKDYQLEKYALECTTKLIEQHFVRDYNYDSKDSTEYNIFTGKYYNSNFITLYLLPIYKIPKQYYGSQTGINTSNVEFANLIILGKCLAYEDGYGYPTILLEIFRQYTEHIIQQIKEKSEIAISCYINAMFRINSDFDSWGFNELGRIISNNNIVIAKDLNINISSKSLRYLFSVQIGLAVKLFEINDINDDFYDYLIEEYLVYVFELLKVFIEREPAEDTRFTYELNYSKWFEELSIKISQKINSVADEYYSLGLKDIYYVTELKEILNILIQGFGDNSEIIAIVSNKDIYVIKYYSDFIQNLIRIITIYISKYFNMVMDETSEEFRIFNEFIDLYLDCLNLYIILLKNGVKGIKKNDKVIYSDFIDSFYKSSNQIRYEENLLKWKKILLENRMKEMRDYKMSDYIL